MVAGAAVGAIAAGFGTGALQTPEVAGVYNSWGAVDEQSTEIVSAVVLNNPNPVGVSLGALDLRTQVYLNDILVGQGRSDGVQLPQGFSTTKLSTLLDNNQALRWWPVHIANGERTSMRIESFGTASILGWGVDIPGPSEVRTLETGLLDGISSTKPETYSLMGAYGVTVVSREFRWGEVNEETTAIQGKVVVYNDSPFPVAVTEVQFSYILNGVQVGRGIVEDPAVLLPREETVVPLRLSITNARLAEWWPTHIHAGEKTVYETTVEASVQVSLPLFGMQRFDLPVVSAEDQLQTHLLGD